MFGMGWSEMVLIGIVALIVVGPKDLPNMFRSIGQFTGKARGMAREFSRAMESAADESGVNDISKTLKAAANPQKFGLDAVKDAAKTALSPDRQEAKDKMDTAMANAATARKSKAEAASAAEAKAEAAPKAKATAKPKAAAKPKAKAKAPAKPAAKPKPKAKAAAKPKSSSAKSAPKTKASE